MAANGLAGGRKRWTEQREKREPTLYDEWLKQEHMGRASPRGTAPPQQQGAGLSDGTIRAITPDTGAADAEDSLGSAGEDSPKVSTRGTSSYDGHRAHTTTTIVGGGAALDGSERPQSSPSKPRKLQKERAPSSRHGSSASDRLARNVTKANGHRDKPTSKVKPRETSIEEPRPSSKSMSSTVAKSSKMRLPASPSSGAEYLASVPAETGSRSSPSIVPRQLDTTTQRSISPASSKGESKTSSQPASSGRRILHLMKTLDGSYSGNVLVRRDRNSTWKQIRCSIEGPDGDLCYETRSDDDTPKKVLVPALSGCRVRPSVDGDTPYLEVSLPRSDMQIHIKLLTQQDFDSWYAALLYWQSLESSRRSTSHDRQPTTAATDNAVRPSVPPRASSARKRRDRTGSTKSERRTSGVTRSNDTPVIKSGTMVHWDTSVVHSTSQHRPEASAKHSAGAAQDFRTSSGHNRRWRYVEGSLRENGELRLHTDSEKSLISVVQLSQLSRCAIQRLDPSVMNDDFCIAIYPQYTSIRTDNESDLMRPLFLSLENRVSYEVWFVLLRAFTIPQLYGPRTEDHPDAETIEADADPDYANMIAAQTIDMFRMERSVNIRIIEAKLYTFGEDAGSPPPASSGPVGKEAQGSSSKADHHGYYAEVLLDNETRGKTTVKFDGLTPLWSESFEFLDLPPVLRSASVLIKRRHSDTHDDHDGRADHNTKKTTSEQSSSHSLSQDIVCGKVEVYLQELEQEKEVEKWWPILNNFNEHVGEMLIKARAEEGVILMARDYQALGDVLHRFSNGISLQIAQMVPQDLKRVSDCLLDIYQVSGKAGEWIMALAEEEIDGVHKEVPTSKLRFNRRKASEGDLDDVVRAGSRFANRNDIVRDLGKAATFEANLLFRGNTLLTKSLDSHMRRVGKEYLEESLGPRLRLINSKDPDCEVDPSRVSSPLDLEKNWRRLLLCTQELWKAIVAAQSGLPIELRMIFRHIRFCAEDRYGDFLRSVSYSSVSGFIFLRFFCPAILNPKLFGLLKEDIKPRARRTFTLIAKSLQTLANMASFGSKETWMEPMNAFLSQNRMNFKTFIDNICYVPEQLPPASDAVDNAGPPTYPAMYKSTETNADYDTPATVMQRLPPTSREGFPSLPFLIDQPRAYADLVQLWLEATTVTPDAGDTFSAAKVPADNIAAIEAAGGDLMTFHEICTTLHRKTQDCLSRAERAERPNSVSSFRLDELIDQLRLDGGVDPQDLTADVIAGHLGKYYGGRPSTAHDKATHPRDWDVLSAGLEDDSTNGSGIPTVIPGSQTRARAKSDFVLFPSSERPVSSGGGGVMRSLRSGLHRSQLRSRGSDSHSAASGSGGNVSSVVSSDTEQTTAEGPTALPNYDRELRHRERREAAKALIREHVETSARAREAEKEKEVRRRVRGPIVSALRKRNLRESKGGGQVGEYSSFGI